MLKKLIEDIVSDDVLHAKWLNTLSYMENCGARKISKCEHPTRTDLEMLKHAAEEHRHAYFLKKMIERVQPNTCPDYERSAMLGAFSSTQYLHKIDLFASRYLLAQGMQGEDLINGAYILVTYAIEVRADDLYPVYQEVLKKNGSTISVYNIIKEEEGHLEHIQRAMRVSLPNYEKHAKAIVEFETQLFEEWVNEIQMEVLSEQQIRSQKIV